MELRDQPVAGIESASAKTRAKAGQVRAGVREKTVVIQQRGREMLVEQKGRVANIVEAGKKAAAKRSAA